MVDDKKMKHSVIPVNVEIKGKLNELRVKLGSDLQGPLSYNALLAWMLNNLKDE